MNTSLSFGQALSLRENYIGGSCQLHYGKSPLKISSSSGQYLVDVDGVKYIDCASQITNIGHCHPELVKVVSEQLPTLSSCIESPVTERLYAKKLLSTLKKYRNRFKVCLFTNSGSEANDLALQLAANYTKKRGVVVIDDAFHGGVTSCCEISPKIHNKLSTTIKDNVYVIPCPDTYRGCHGDKVQLYLDDAKAIIDQVEQDPNKVGIGCFISEPILIAHGVVIPPQGWLSNIYSYIRSKGGLIICDEIQSGTGRSCKNFWSFQSVDDGRAVPDIITVGKPIGNGHPLAAVITSYQIIRCTPNVRDIYRCGPVESLVGTTVLDILDKENLLSLADKTGTYMRQRFRDLQQMHVNIGDVRGIGAITGVDIVHDHNDKVPWPELAEKICYCLKNEHILAGADGVHSNVVIFLPPFCLTMEDVDCIVHCFNKVLTQLTLNEDSLLDILLEAPTTSATREDNRYDVTKEDSDEDGRYSVNNISSYNNLD